MDVDAHAEELASTLGIDKAEVKADLENLLEYSVPIDEAKQSVRRKHGGGSGGSSPSPTTVDLAEITTDHGNVTVTVRVLTVGTRTIRYQGEDITIREGELADGTGRISYTAWQDFGFEPGDSLTIGNAGVREWEGEPELNLGDATTVAIADDDVTVDATIGGDRDLIDLDPGDRGRNIEVRVLKVDSKTISGRDGETPILEGVVGDETARLPFTDWDPRSTVEAGADLRIEDVYVREFRGVPSINLTAFSTVTPLPDPVPVNENAPRLSIADAIDTGGMFDVEVVGTVLDLREGSGFIERCPDCGRVLQSGQCRSHGDVEGEDDLRVRAILDDGTATTTVVLNADLTADVYGGGLEDAREAAREAMDKSVVAESIADELVGRAFRVRGNLSVDDYGANLDAETFTAADDDPAETARSVLSTIRSRAATDGGRERATGGARIGAEDSDRGEDTEANR
ncbi:replication factor A1 [Halopenitus malekzadehii]|uniref:Replication factor A1 n=1 Tax=Halopenitus malekzadehii TaxID=1267564 RepID=A0A1H6J7Q2_9EURY|nr:replication factor A1 [Halopenitus malekzadehii]